MGRWVGGWAATVAPAPRSVATIFQALGVHGGGVGLDDFVAAVEAEDVRSHTPLAAWMRTHPAETKGWGKLPDSLDAML